MSHSTTIENPEADPQTETDIHGIGIDHEGISNVRYPVLITGWETSERQEKKEAVFSLRVSLAPDVRGIHMSRLLDSLHYWGEPLTQSSMVDFLNQIRQQQNAESATVDCSFTWFVERVAPKSQLPSWQGIETTWHSHSELRDTTLVYTLNIPVTTLCPCSRDISDYDAHRVFLA